MKLLGNMARTGRVNSTASRMKSELDSRISSRGFGAQPAEKKALNSYF